MDAPLVRSMPTLTVPLSRERITAQAGRLQTKEMRTSSASLENSIPKLRRVWFFIGA